MKRLSNRALALITAVCLVLSSFLFYYSYTNIKRYSETSRLYKNQNERVKEKIKDSENDINVLNSKISLIDKKLKTLNDKVLEYDSMKLVNRKEDFEKYLLSALSGNLDRDRRNSATERSSRYRKLRSTYFNDYEVASKDETLSNMLVNSLLFNEYLYSNVNKEIVANNNKVYKNVGLYDFYENTNNYFIKSKIAKSISKGVYPVMEESLLSADRSILDLKYKNLMMFDTLLFPTDANYMYISSLKDSIAGERKAFGYDSSKKEVAEISAMGKKIDTAMLFGIDVFSQNIDYEKNYDILDKTYETKDGVQVLRYLTDGRGRVYLAEERINGEARTLSYYNAGGSPFVQFDIKNYRIYYFNSDSSKQTADKYNHSLEILKKYKRD